MALVFPLAFLESKPKIGSLRKKADPGVFWVFGPCKWPPYGSPSEAAGSESGGGFESRLSCFGCARPLGLYHEFNIFRRMKLN